MFPQSMQIDQLISPVENLFSGVQGRISNNGNRQQSQSPGNIESFQRTDINHNLIPFISKILAYHDNKLKNNPNPVKIKLNSSTPDNNGKTITPRNSNPKFPVISERRFSWAEDNFINLVYHNQCN